MLITSLPKQRKSSSLKKQIAIVSQNLFQMLEAACHMCFHPYNSNERLPMCICAQEHTYCSKCVNSLFKIHPHETKCPTCRVFICQKGIRVNKSLSRICDILPKLALKFTNIERQNHQLLQRIQKMQKQYQQRQKQYLQKNLSETVQHTKGEKVKLDNKQKNLLIGIDNVNFKAKKLNSNVNLPRKRNISSLTNGKTSRKQNIPSSLNKRK